MEKEVIFYRDGSAASARVEAGLIARGIKYRTKWADPNDLMLPALEVGKTLFETIPSIEFYLFSRLDRGRTIGGITAHSNNRAITA